VRPESLIHCNGAYTDDLPAPATTGEARTKDVDVRLAQCSPRVPRMFKDFEVDYASRICARFGLVYYGCCDRWTGRCARCA